MVNDLFREYLDSDTPAPVRQPKEPFTVTTWQRDFLLQVLAPTIAEASEVYKNLADALIASGIIMPPLPKEPRARALAAKQRQGKGPPSQASWRGRERNTKFRSQ